MTDFYPPSQIRGSPASYEYQHFSDFSLSPFPSNNYWQIDIVEIDT